MIREIAVLTIDPAEAEEFEKTYLEVAPVLRRQPGYIHDELLRVVEHDNEYILIVKWESVQAHKAFIDSDEFALLAEPWGLFQKKAEVRHCRTVSEG